MIPILYKADEKDFSTQGLGMLSDVQSAKVTEQRNAQYYLDIDIPVFSKMFKEVKLERLIKVDDHNDENQLFRIKKIDTPSQGICSIYAEHISRDIEGYTINPDITVLGTAEQALSIWKKNLLEKDKVTVHSDVKTVMTSKRWTIDNMENPFFYLGGKEGSILQLYKGEYRFDNLNIHLLKERGYNTGASITYGRNMSELSQEDSIEELANSIYPFAWKEQEENQAEDKREMIILDPLYVDGPHIDKYAERRVVFVDFTDKNPKDKDALKKLAEKYVKDNNVGAPKVSMTVSPVLNGQIAKGLELEKFEQVNLCDIVTVKYHKLGIDVQAKVNEVTFDALSQRFSEYKLGDEKRTLSSSLGAIETNVNSMGKELQDITGWAQQSADGKNTIFYGKDEPKANKVGDTWFKDNPDGSTTIHVWDGQTWKEVKTDYTEEFEQLDKELTEQKENIDKSLEQSEQAIKDSNLSIEKAEQAEQNANKAVEEAGFVGKQLGSVKETIDYQSNKITELDETTISNGKQIEEIGTGLKETITKTDEHGKQITQINKDYNGLSSTVVDIQKDIDNMELPARNLVRNSLIEECVKPHVVASLDLVEEWAKEDQYRIIIKSKNYPDLKISMDTAVGSGLLKDDIQYDDSISAYSYYGKIGANNLINHINVKKYNRDGKQNNDTEFCIDWIAVYKNDDKTTAWYPALEDNAKSMAELWTEVNQHSDEINLQAGQIKDGQAKLTEVELTTNGLKTSVSELENMEIGGRNYFLNSEKLDKNNVVPFGGSRIASITNDVEVIEWETNKATTVYVDNIDKDQFFCILQSKSKSKSNGKSQTTSIYFRNDSILPITLFDNVGSTCIVKAKETTRVVMIVKETPKKSFYQIPLKMRGTSARFTLWHPKIERANKVSDWSPAPEDVNNKISVVEQTVDGIKQTVQNKADKSEVTQLAGQITQSVQDAGATNMVMNSNFINGDMEPWTGHTKVFYVSTNIDSQYLSTPSIDINKSGETVDKWYGLRSERVKIMDINTPLSASVMFKTYKNLDGLARLTLEFFEDETSNRIDSVSINAKQGMDGKWQELKIENHKIKDNRARYVSVLYQLQRNGHCVWSRPMLNLGEKCLPYNASTIHQSQITQTKDMVIQTVKDTDGKFSKVQQSIDGIQQTVKGKADQSQVTQLDNQITQVVKSTELPNLITNSSMINRDYSGWTLGDGWYSSIVTRGGNGALSIKHNATQPLSRAINDFLEIRSGSILSFSIEAFIESTVGGDFYSAIAFYDDSQNYISEIRVDLNNKKMKEWNTFVKEGIVVPSNSRYTRVAVLAVGDVWGYFGKPLLVQSDTIVTYRPSEVSQSQIAQTKDMINLKVSKGDVMSQVNIDAKNILFESNRIVLDAKTTVIKGETWMDGAIIKDASIGTAQIKNASITSAKIGSLDAGKITTGTLKGIYIDMSKVMSIEEGGFIQSLYDYGDSSYDSRWYTGGMKVGNRVITYTADIFEYDNGKKGKKKYYSESYFGGDTLKLRQYANSSQVGGTPKYHFDATSTYLRMGEGWESDISLDGITGTIYSKKLESTHGVFTEDLRVNGESGLLAGRINAPNGVYDTLRINYERDLGRIMFGKDGNGRYILSDTIYNRKYKQGDGRVVITDAGTLGTSANLLSGTTFDRVSAKSMSRLSSSVVKLEPFAKASKGGNNISYSVKDIERLGLSELCYKDSDGKPVDLNPDKFIIVQMELIKELRERCNKLEYELGINEDIPLKLVASI